MRQVTTYLNLALGIFNTLFLNSSNSVLFMNSGGGATSSESPHVCVLIAQCFILVSVIDPFGII